MASGPCARCGFMCGIECIGNLDSDLPRFLDGKRAVREPRLQNLAT